MLNEMLHNETKWTYRRCKRLERSKEKIPIDLQTEMYRLKYVILQSYSLFSTFFLNSITRIKRNKVYHLVA